MIGEAEKQTRWGLTLTIKGDRRLRRLLTQPGGEGVKAFNRLVRQLGGILDAVWMSHEEPPPLVMAIQFDGMVLAGMKLDSIDLLHVSICGTDLSGASLRGARFGMCDGADFHGADLTGSDFSLASISGCSFDGSVLTDANFKGATQDRINPPRGLPDFVQGCRPLDWSEPTGRPGDDRPPLPWVRLRASLQLLDIGALLGDGD